MKCVVQFCKNKKFTRRPGISFHRFPKNEILRQIWLEVIGQPNLKPTSNNFVCSEHFLAKDIFICDRRNKLSIDAVPNLKLNLKNNDDFVPHTQERNISVVDAPSEDESFIELNATNFQDFLDFQSLQQSKEGLTNARDIKEHSRYEFNQEGSPNMPPCYEGQEVVVLQEQSTPTIFIESMEQTIPHQEISSVTGDISELEDPDISTTLMQENSEINKNVCKNKECRTKILSLQKQVKRLRKALRRRDKKIGRINTAMEILKKKELISEQMHKVLDAIAGPNKSLFERQLFEYHGKKHSKIYSPQIRAFALSLNFLSPRAYEYVRETFSNCLPHNRTLRKWYENVECDPGFTKEAFDAIKKAVQETTKNGEKLCLQLIFDEIHIRQHIDWDGKKLTGFVDFGSGSNKDTVATQMLVFLAVAINKSWKIPLAFFPISSLTKEQKQNIILLCLQHLVDTGAQVVGLTFDGMATNFAVANLFGSDIRDLKSPPFFKIDNSDEKYILHPDPCHMFKLVRNAFFKLGILYDIDGNEIRWDYLAKLVDLQEKEGLHLGNKIRKAHIYFQNQKMKVSLAVQTLSKSVADAFDFCREVLNLEAFVGSKTTANFIRLLDDVFDILNSRKVSEYEYKKKALCKNNISHINDFICYAIKYISQLTLPSKVCIVKTTKNSGFLGLIRCLENVKMINERFIESGILSFFPLYKISQDHIELFFSSIRMGLGSNNNPSVKQFISTYKKLLFRCQIRQGGIGNCLALEQITILNASSADPLEGINKNLTKSKILRSSLNEEENVPMSENDMDVQENVPIADDDLIFLEEHSYAQDPSAISTYAQHVVEYIAGYIVFAINKKLLCSECLTALQGDFTPSSLITYKSKGFLKIPSQSVKEICEKMEKEIRRTAKLSDGLHESLSPKESENLLIRVQQAFIGKELFSDQTRHMIESGHYALLLKLITEKYLKVRYNFIAKSTNDKISIRQKYTKLILFNGM